MAPLSLLAQVVTERQVEAAFPHPVADVDSSRRVLEALKSLAGRLDGISRELKTAQADHVSASAALSSRRQKNLELMDEYRNGQFCSGCGKMRSQFKPGEGFPHRGERVIIPTAEEVAAKEKQFRQELLPLEERVKEQDAKIRRLEKLAPPVLEQLNMGKALWVTATNLVDEQVTLNAKLAKVAEVDERTKTRGLILKQESAVRGEADPDKRAVLNKELQSLRDAGKRHELRLAAIERLKERLFSASSEVAEREAADFNIYVSSLPVSLDVVRSPGTLARLNRFGVGGTFQLAGGYFLMGEVPEQWTDRTDAFAKGVVDRWMRMPGYSGFYGEMVLPSSPGKPALPTSAGTADDSKDAIKRAIREERERQRADEEAAAKARKAR
jgi:hypothetical protein